MDLLVKFLLSYQLGRLWSFTLVLIKKKKSVASLGCSEVLSSIPMERKLTLVDGLRRDLVA